MPTPIDFWFAFSSPSGYLASHRIDQIAAKHGRATRWRSFNIRAVLEEEGVKPNVMYPRKGRYARLDWDRTARQRGIPFRFPEPFGRSSVPAMTIYYWIERQKGEGVAKSFAKKVMYSYFVENAAIDDPNLLATIATTVSIDGTAARQAIDDPGAKAALDRATSEASSAGVWGSPFIIVDGQPFWGEDRLDQVDLWLERGGW